MTESRHIVKGAEGGTPSAGVVLLRTRPVRTRGSLKLKRHM